MNINKEINIIFIDDKQTNVDCVHALEHDINPELCKIITYFIDNNKSSKKTITTILSIEVNFNYFFLMIHV